MAPPKTIRTSKGDILNELKRRHSEEKGQSQLWRVAKKHYIPNAVGHAGALMMASNLASGPYKADMMHKIKTDIKDDPFSDKTPRNVLLMNAPVLAGATIGAGIGLMSGRIAHKREKLMTERLKEHHHDDLFNQLSDRGKEDYALYLGKEKGMPILKELQEKRKKENEAVRDFRKNYKNQISLNNDEEGVEKEASISKIALTKAEQAFKDWGMGNPEKMKKDEIYDELVARRMEALGKKPSGFKRRDFKDAFKKSFTNPAKLLGHGIVAAVSGFGAHADYKDHLANVASGKIKDGVNKYDKTDSQSKGAARVTTPLFFGPGLHTLTSGTSALSTTIDKAFKRKKNRFELADYSTDELEKKLGRNMLTKLYREHGAEGEEHTS